MKKLLKCSLKKEKYVELIFFLLISLILITIISIVQKKWVLEDAFITYRYAENIASGNGFVYNLGEPSLGTTTPFYTLILALSSIFYPNIELISYLIGLASLFIITILMFNLFKQLKYPFGGILGALLISINSEMFVTYGMETLFYTMLIFASIYFYFNEKFKLTSILLAMLVFTRLDGFVLAFLIFIDMYYRHKIIKVPLVLFSLILLPWFIYSYHTFGLLVPSTVSAKMVQIDSGIWVESFAYAAIHKIITKYFVLFLLSALGLLYSIKFKKQYLIIFYWIFFYYLAYTLIDVPYYGWYLTPLIPALIFGAILGSLYIYDSIVKFQFINYEQSKPFIAIIIVLSLFVSTIYVNVKDINNYINSPDIEKSNQREAFYKEIGKWFNQHTNISDSIETVEIGVIGYYSKRKIIDGAGLIQPDISQHILKKDLDWSINEYKPDYIVFSPMFRQLLPPGKWINDYRIVEKYTISSGEWYIVKRRSNINDSNAYYYFTEDIPNAAFINIPSHDSLIWIMNEGDEMKYSFFELPPAVGSAKIIFNKIFIPVNSSLEFAISLDEQVWYPSKGDGVNFTISLTNMTTTQTLFTKYIDPKKNENDRKWHKSQINLTEWNGENVSFVFETSSGPKNDSSYDWARWGNPVIIINR